MTTIIDNHLIDESLLQGNDMTILEKERCYLSGAGSAGWNAAYSVDRPVSRLSTEYTQGGLETPPPREALSAVL